MQSGCCRSLTHKAGCTVAVNVGKRLAQTNFVNRWLLLSVSIDENCPRPLPRAPWYHGEDKYTGTICSRLGSPSVFSETLGFNCWHITSDCHDFW